MPINHSLSQPTVPQPTYPQQTALYASQPQYSIPDPNPTHLQPTEQHWQTAGKEAEKRKARKIRVRTSKTTGLGELYPPPIDTAHCQKNTWRNQPSKALNRNHHQSSY